ncbi:MAG: hypothetical protein HZT43_01335 [Exiguobacterium profundum]|nr:MAG: hypothetical protein HZT43_01335 [Exiguobacterium profundum]
MLRRVQRLEALRATPRSPFEREYGSLAAFEDHVAAQMAAGKLDRDFPFEGIVRMHQDGCFGHWTKTRRGYVEWTG